VERFLNHEPVAAGPPTAGYKLRKFVRRNRGPVAAAGLVLAALLAGIAGTTWQAVRATQAEGRTADQLEKTREAEAAATAEAGKARAAEAVAVEREKKEAAARKEADDQRKAATEKAAAATAAKEFLQSVLVQGDPDEATKDRAADLNRTLRAALDWASKDIEGRFADQPAIAADLRGTIGVAYRELGAYAAAERHLRAALSFSETAHGPDHPDTRASVNNLAVLYRKMGELAAAERLLKRALAGSEKVLGPDHLTTLVYVHNLALLYQDLGDLKAAEPLYNRALAGEEKALGPDHPETLTAVHNLATLYQYKGDLAAAERLLKRALAGREKALGPDHPRTLSSAANLAQLYWLMDRLDRSVPLFEDVYPRMRRVLGDGHPDTLITVANLGVNLKDAGGAAEGVPLLEQAYAARAKYPAQLGWVGHQLIDAYAKAGQPTDAKRVAGEVLAEGRARLKPGSPDLGGLLATTGSQLLDLDPAAAEPVLRECLELRQKLAPAAWTTANAKSLLGGALLRRGKPAEAEALLVAGYEGLLADRRNIPPLPAAQVNLPDAADRLVEVYRTLNRPAEVARWRAERAKYPPPTAPPPRPVVK
ncbi:MAG: tetratricopeptide repeat protein, partial [Gemmataceae bacterium]|nr:tetratricopeptide repeat protein [Gemmataceae bacterium]